MKVLFLASLFVAVNAFAADKIHLNCSTQGHALSLVTLYESGGKPLMKIKFSEADEEEDPSEIYLVTADLKNIAAGDSDTLVAQKVGSEDYAYGGGLGDAVLMRVLPGQKKAFLAAVGKVYYLNCFKPAH